MDYSEILKQYVSVLIDSEFGVIVTDANENIVFINKMGEQMIGLKYSQMASNSLKAISLYLDTADTIRTGCSAKNQAVINNSTYVINKIALVERGQIIGAMVLLNDISGLCADDEQLSFDVLFDAISDGVTVSNGEGLFLRANKAYQTISGIGEKDIVGKHARKLVEERFVNKSVVEKVLETHKMEYLTQRLKSGRELLNTGIPIFNQQGEMVRIVTVLRDWDELNSIKQRLFEVSEENKQYLEKMQQLKNGFDSRYVIYSQKMKNIFDMVKRVASVDSTILITGESGTGKEAVAQYIHQNSQHRDAPYVKVNCGAIAETLIEAELFGYEGGAFTGALKGGKKGLLEVAQNGTILFDEIGELSLNMQVKLLRILQEREFCRVGGTKPINVDCRFVFATNKDLLTMVEQGNFREDLFYRCNVVVINIPPLRERKEDIIPLVMFFLKNYNERYHQQKRVTKDVLAAFSEHNWPGNIRELQNVVERLVVTSPKDLIDSNSLYKFGFKNIDSSKELNQSGLKETLEKIEKEIIMEAYCKTGCTRKAAAILGINQSTVVKKMKKYGLKTTNGANDVM